MNKAFIKGIKNYQFVTFNPFQTFTNKNKSFINNNGKPVARYESFYELYSMGKRAFDLLEINSENDLKKLCHGYFIVVHFLLEISLLKHSEGKLRFTNTESGSVTDINHLQNVLINPDIYSLIDIAPSFFKFGFELGDVIDKALPKDEIDILNDVYLASLVHTLIEIDNAICAFDIGSPEALIATQEATKSFEYAAMIKTKREFEKNQRIAKAKFAATKRHERTTIAKNQLRDIWATGKYSSRDICAEQECANLDISFSTARKALRNTPEPTK